MSTSACKSLHIRITNEEKNINVGLGSAFNKSMDWHSWESPHSFTMEKSGCRGIPAPPSWMAGSGWLAAAHTHTLTNQKDIPQLIFPCSLRAHGQAPSRDLIKKNVFLHIGGGPWQDSPGRWKANEGNESNCQWLKALVWYSASEEWGLGPKRPDRKGLS